MIELIKEVDALARQRYTYTADKPNKDSWVSHASEVLNNKHWYGDCDDLVSTVCDLLTSKGIPKDNIWFAEVSSQKNHKIDHLIGIVKDGKDLWIVGDTFQSCYKIQVMEHELVKACSLTRPFDWFPASVKLLSE